MNIHTQFKTLALLCALPLSNSFAAQPNSLYAKIAAIDAMPDHEILSIVMPRTHENAEQCLVDCKNDLKQDPFLNANQMPKKHAKVKRLVHKYWVTNKELELCNDNAQKQYLQAQRDGFDAQFAAAKKEEQETLNSLIVNQTMPLATYNYLTRRFNVFQCHASLLLAQKEKLQKEQSQLQQEKQSLLGQLKGYQLLEDGQQIEGMPHAPGGVPFKKEHKRRGSF